MESTTATNEDAAQLVKKPTIFATYAELAKIRLSLLTVVTAGVGFVMASPLGIDWKKLFFTVLGTLACACSASALNQLTEHQKDAKMERTRERPIPAGHVSKIHAFVFGILLGYIGIALLSFFVNVESAGIAFATILLYVLVYTPLKTRTSLNTFVGAVVGALPPLIGWVGATGGFGRGGIVLAGILFIWQIPHFLALACMYKEDYDRGGFKMLTAFGGSEEFTARISVITSMCLIPLCLLLTMVGTTGTFFAVTATLLGIHLTWKSFGFWKAQSIESARSLFFATIIYLPLLLMCMLISRNTIEWIDMTVLHG